MPIRHSTIVENPLQIGQNMQNKANVKLDKMDITSLLTSKYEQMDIWWNGKNKANSKPIFKTGRPVIKPMKPAYSVRKAALRAKKVPFRHLTKQRRSNTPAEISGGVYKSRSEQYHIRHISRCSSMVEHSFRKAGVEGPTPSIGFSGYMRACLLRESLYGNSN